MNVIPIGRMRKAKELKAPVVVAASADSPRCATITASARPMTDWLEREITIGHARASSARTSALGAAGNSFVVMGTFASGAGAAGSMMEDRERFADEAALVVGHEVRARVGGR